MGGKLCVLLYTSIKLYTYIEWVCRWYDNAHIPPLPRLQVSGNARREQRRLNIENIVQTASRSFPASKAPRFLLSTKKCQRTPLCMRRERKMSKRGGRLVVGSLVERRRVRKGRKALPS